ncbi:MAG: PepSY domain-containing protein [Pseudomonadota bacterium]
MKRLTVLFATLLIGAALPAAAQAQGCPKGPAGKACRDAERAERVAPGDRRGGNSLGDSWQPREDDARDGVRGGRLVPLETVIRNIARTTPGHLLDAGLEGGDRPVYRVRWQAADGRRIDFIVDARTGQIIGRY